jgi:glutamyl-tRNA reductase
MKTQDSHHNNIPIVVIGFNHQTANVQIREKATFTNKQQNRIIEQFSKKYNTRGVIMLSTCNRTEIYLCGRRAIKYLSDIRTWLDSIVNEPIFCNDKIVYIYKGGIAVHHFFRVISSLDSQMIGEPQITGQVKDAYEHSHHLKHTDVLINKMYQFGMEVEKEVRSKTYLADGAVSVSFAAVELARKIFGNLQNTAVLLIGAGETAELAAQHFAARQALRILVINRTYKNACQVAAKFQGEAIKFEKLAQAVEQADIVISATSSDQALLDKDLLQNVAKQRNYKPLFLIDLAIPRNIEPSVSEIDGVFLYNLDNLEEVVHQNIEQRRKEIPKAEKIVNQHVSKYLNWYNTLPVVKTIKQLSSFFEEIREQEFNRLKNRFSEKNREEAEYLSKSLMKKFLHHHIISLRKNHQDPQRQKLHIDLVGEIYKLNESESEDDKKN